MPHALLTHARSVRRLDETPLLKESRHTAHRVGPAKLSDYHEPRVLRPLLQIALSGLALGDVPRADARGLRGCEAVVVL